MPPNRRASPPLFFFVVDQPKCSRSFSIRVVHQQAEVILFAYDAITKSRKDRLTWQGFLIGALRDRHGFKGPVRPTFFKCMRCL